METCTLIAFLLASVGISPGDCSDRTHYVAERGGTVVTELPRSRCPACRAMSMRSQVYPGMCSRTLMGWQPYYDERGNYHSEDPNVTTCEYRCSLGHSWSEASR